MKKDNSTIAKKIGVRRAALRALCNEAPVILETHGGTGGIYREVYTEVWQGVVFETDAKKAEILAHQRPSWSVYEADCEKALRAGVGAHLTINLLDCDPYGDPWPVLDAFFSSERSFAEHMLVAVNDGLRQKLKMGGAWSTGSMSGMVARFGNDLQGIYLDVCEVLMAEKAAQAGYRLHRFNGYYCGHAQQMTHYLAELTRDTAAGPA